MRLDLSLNGNLELKQALLLNQIAKELRKPYINFIARISESHNTNLDWWADEPAGRNTLTDPLFYYISKVELLKKIIQSGESITEITVDSNALKIIIENIIKSANIKTKVTLQITLLNKIKDCLRYMYNIFSVVIYYSAQLYFARRTVSKKNSFNKSMILIDNYVLPNFVDKDRVYTDLWENLTEDNKKLVCFVTNIFGFKLLNLKKIYQKLRDSSKNIMFKEDYLTINDYLYSFLHCFRILKIKIQNANFNEIDYTQMIYENFKTFKTYNASVLALLNYRFVKKLKEIDHPVKVVINRFENQIIDKGWNAGFQKYFPQIKIIGYQSFIMPPYYLCGYPTLHEKQNRKLPNQIAVMGEGYIDFKKEFCEDLDFIVAPAFGFQWLWKDRIHYPDPDYFTILVALPGPFAESKRILHFLNDNLKNIKLKSNFRVWIKTHPTSSLLLLYRNFNKKWPKIFQFVEGNFNDLVDKSNLVIGSQSSVCLEIIARGIPVIVPGNPNGITQNPIPDNIEEEIWSLCYTKQDLTKAIKFYEDRSIRKNNDFKQIGDSIREKFFAPLNKKSINSFLGL